MVREEGEIKELGKKLAQNPDSMVFVQLADAYRRAGNLEQSVEVCLQGLERHPTYTTARVILGRNYFDLGKLEEAASEFHQIEAVDPENILAHRMLGQIALNKGQFADAISRQQKVLALDPDDSTAQDLLQQALQAKQGESASKQAPASKAASPDEHAQALKVADIYIKKRALDKAAEVVQEILASDPNHALSRRKMDEINALKGGAGADKGNEDKGNAEADADRRAREEADRRAKEEADRRAKEEADRRAKEEADRRAKEDADRRAKEDADRRAKEDADRRAREDADRRAKEEADRKAKEEARRKSEKEAEIRGRGSDKFTAEDILSVIAGSAEDLIENEGSAAKPPKAPGANPAASGLIKAFLQAQAIEASLLLDAKGKVLEYTLDGDPVLLGQVAGAVFQSAERAAKNVGLGGLKQVMISCEGNRQILFLGLAAGVLVAVTGKDTNVGQLRVAVHDLMKRA